MALKIRQRKKEEKKHPDYLLGQERTWADNDRERTKDSFRRNFVAILAVIVVIAVLLIASAVITVTNSIQEQQITAADTFSVTQYEQQQMKEYANRFAQGVLVYSYCSDQDTAFAGKNAALSTMAQNTDSYTNVMNLLQANPIVSPNNLVPVVTEPEMLETTRAYASTVTYVFSAVAADSSDTTDTEDGSFIDAGYNISVTFSPATDERTGENVWVITDCSMQAK